MATAKNPLLIGFQAARANVIPGIIVQILMLSLVLAYYFWPSAADSMKHVADFKERTGVAFVVVSTVLAAAVLPEILKILCFQQGRATRQNLRTVLIAGVFWGVQGVIVNALYLLQSQLFGDAPTIRTIATKVAVDQFIYNPFFAAIANAATYYLLNVGFTWPHVRACATWRFYRNNVVPVLMATWGVWIPVTAAVYAMPGPLQFPLFALALTFWASMLAWIGQAQSRRQTARELDENLADVSPAAK